MIIALAITTLLLGAGLVCFVKADKMEDDEQV